MLSWDSRPLLPHEKGLIQCVEWGEKWRPNEPGINVDEKVYWDPAFADQWSDDRVFDAEFIRTLILGREWPIHEKGILISGAFIRGRLDLEEADVHKSVWFSNCYFDSPITMKRCRARTLSLQGCNIPSLMANGAIFDGDVLLRSGFIAQDYVDLLGAKIISQLNCRDSQFNSDDDGIALNCAGISIGSTVFMDEGFQADGAVILRGASIGGQLSCRGGDFKCTDDAALDCDAAVIEQDAFLDDGFKAKGPVLMRRARIAGQLSLDNAKLFTKNGIALDCTSAQIGSSVFLRDGFAAEGTIDFTRAHITGQLNARSAKLTTPGAITLDCDSIRVDGDVFLDNGFTSRGTVNFRGARIAGNLSCLGGQFINPDGEALVLYGAELEDLLLRDWQDGGRKKAGFLVDGQLDLRGAHVRALYDDKAVLNENTEIVLDGFEFQRFGDGSPTDAQTRLHWLNRQPRAHTRAGAFKPQPWAQLAAVLTSMGQTASAKRILFHREHAELVNGTAGFLTSLLHLPTYILRAPHRVLLWWTAGHGYYPVNALIWALAIIAIGWQTTSIADKLGLMRPANEQVLLSEAYQADGTVPKDYEPLRPLLYSADTFLPGLNLQQRQYWIPRGADDTDVSRAAMKSALSDTPSSISGPLTAPLTTVFDAGFAKYWLLAQRIFGGVLVFIFFGSVLGFFTRNKG